MATRMASAREIPTDWLLNNVPFVSLYCANDPFYTMRLLCHGKGEVFGYQLESFVQNKQYFAASTIYPQDQDIVDAHVEQALTGASPVVSRYRIVAADGELIPILLVGKAVFKADGQIIGLAGNVLDIRGMDELQGSFGVLSQGAAPKLRRPPATEVENPGLDWLGSQLPVGMFFAENDADFTVRASLGSTEELMGYSAEEFVNTRRYRPASTVAPLDEDIADAYVEHAASREGALSVVRLRLIQADGSLAPMLIVVRGATPREGEALGVAGGLFNISDVPALQGPSKVLVAR